MLSYIIKYIYISDIFAISFEGQEFEREIEAGETILKYPEGNKFPAIQKVHLYVPDSIQDRVVIREEDKDYVVITWVS